MFSTLASSLVRKSRTVLFVLAAWMLFPVFSTNAQEIGGIYRGIDSAQGITIQLSRGGNGYVGEIIAGSGGRVSLNAEAVPGGARGPLVLRGQPGIVELQSLDGVATECGR